MIELDNFAQFAYCAQNYQTKSLHIVLEYNCCAQCWFYSPTAKAVYSYYAQLQCMDTMHGYNARSQCTDTMHIYNARSQCMAIIHGHNAQRKCTITLHSHNVGIQCTVRMQNSYSFVPFMHTVKTIIRVDFLFFLFGISLDSHYESTLIVGRLLLICVGIFQKYHPIFQNYHPKKTSFLQNIAISKRFLPHRCSQPWHPWEILIMIRACNIYIPLYS